MKGASCFCLLGFLFLFSGVLVWLLGFSDDVQASAAGMGGSSSRR